jgi:hypothetical protein
MGLEMFEAGARAMEAGAAQIHRQMHLVSTEEERADMLQEADHLAREAASLRAQARELAARDLATLRPMSEEEGRQMAIQLQNLRALPEQMQMGMPLEGGVDIDLRADVSADINPGRLALPIALPVVPDPPPPPREAIAAGLREGAGKVRADAARMDADAARIEQNRSAPEEMIDHAESLRQQANDLRSQADDLDQQAADVLND